jgi:hypothetical protein
MVAGWPFAILGTVYALVAVGAWAATRREARSQHDLVAFDLTVEYGVSSLAFVMLAIAGLTDPTILVSAEPDHGQALMASGTVLGFAALGAGRLAFVSLRRRGQRGDHPFQDGGQSIGTAAVAAVETLSEVEEWRIETTQTWASTLAQLARLEARQEEIRQVLGDILTRL